MKQNNDPESIKKWRLSPMVIILIGIGGILAFLLILPSSREVRLRKAREYLTQEFPTVSEDSVKPLLRAYLVSDNSFVNFSTRHEYAIEIFRPNPAVYDRLEMLYNSPSGSPYLTTKGEYPVALLLAPDASSVGWTVFAKIWIAKVLQKQQVHDLKELGLEMPSNPKVFGRLKKIWAKVPLKIQEKATAIIEENRRLAKPFKSTAGFYHKEVTYAISDGHDRSEFFRAFAGANPEKIPRIDR